MVNGRAKTPPGLVPPSRATEFRPTARSGVRKTPKRADGVGRQGRHDRGVCLGVGYLVGRDAGISAWGVSGVEEEEVAAQCPAMPVHTGTGVTPGLLDSGGTACDRLLVFRSTQYDTESAGSSGLAPRRVVRSSGGSRWGFSVE